MDRLKTAATALVIREDKIEALISAYDIFAETERSVLDELFSGRNRPHIISDKDREPFLDSPSYRCLVDLIHELNDAERIDLNALGWLGAGRFPDWQRSIAHAEKMAASLDPEYSAGYGQHWRTGYNKRAAET